MSRSFFEGACMSSFAPQKKQIVTILFKAADYHDGCDDNDDFSKKIIKMTMLLLMLLLLVIMIIMY